MRPGPRQFNTCLIRIVSAGKARGDQMNNSERIDVLQRGEKPDKVPFFPLGGNGFALVSNNYPIVTVYNDFETTLQCYRETAVAYDWLYTPYLAYASMGAWEMGGEIRLPDGEFSQAPSIARHPVNSPEEALSLGLPETVLTGMVPRQVEFYKKVLAEPDDIKAWKVICQIEGVFTFASNMAGGSMFFKWLIRRPDAAHHLLGLAVDFMERLARHLKGLFGTERVLLFSGEPATSNALISPKMFAEFALPHTRELHRRLLDMGYRSIFKHICGEQNLNLEHWGTVPLGSPGFASFGHEVDLERAAAIFPGDILVGNLNPSLIQSGSADEVYRAAEKIIEQGKRLPTGFVFAPGCSLPPQSPPENILAMQRALDDFGWY
jgi:uroporphyrinogen decarboxylase